VFRYHLQNEEEKVVVKLEGDLDIDATEIIEMGLNKEILNSTGVVELDFKNIDFVDSSGIGLLITFVTNLKEIERVLTIKNLKEDIRTVFELLQLDEILGKDVIVL